VTPELAIITPEASPGGGGVADHTLALLRRWRSPENFTLLVATPGPVPDGLVKGEVRLAETRETIAAQLPRNGGTVFVQYSAYGFNRYGYPRHLINALIDWKKRTGARLIIMFHEIWTFWPVTNKNFVIQQFHRRSLRQLLAVCDVVFTTTTSQAVHLRRLCSSAAIEVLPVGSNIRGKPPEPVQRQKRWAVVFGLQGNRIRALEAMGKDLAALAAAGHITKIISVGQGSERQLADREAELLGALDLPEGFGREVALPEEEVSDLLSSVSFGIFGQNELSYGKSGSFMAYAAHQLNVIADFADPSKPPPVCWLVSPREMLGGISNIELDRRAECLRSWQEQTSSWNIIADRLGRALGVETHRASNS
jgi:hypothetical protein